MVNTLFFGFFPALFRADFKWAGIQFLIQVFVAAVTAGYGNFLITLIFSFIYNKLYIQELLNKGYQVENVKSDLTLEQLQAKLELPLIVTAA